MYNCTFENVQKGHKNKYKCNRKRKKSKRNCHTRKEHEVSMFSRKRYSFLQQKRMQSADDNDEQNV